MKSMTHKMLAPIVFLGLSACNVSQPVLCEQSFDDRADLVAGLNDNPDTAEAVGKPAVSLLITLSVCEN